MTRTLAASGLAELVERFGARLAGLACAPEQLSATFELAAELEMAALDAEQPLLAGAAITLHQKVAEFADSPTGSVGLDGLARVWQAHGLHLLNGTEVERDEAWRALQPYLLVSEEAAMASWDRSGASEGLIADAQAEADALRFLADLDTEADEPGEMAGRPGGDEMPADPEAALEPEATAEAFLASLGDGAGEFQPMRTTPVARSAPGPTLVTPPETGAVPAEIVAAFGEEAAQALLEMEQAVLAWEKAPTQSTSSLREIYRLAHSLKGAAQSVGLAQPARVLHRLEDGLDRVLTRDAPGDAAGFTRLVLTVIDDLRFALGEPSWSEEAAAELIDRLDAFEAGSAPVPPRRDEAAAPAAGPSVDRSLRDHPTIRVDVSRLDGLMNLAGDLLVNRYRLNRKLQQVNVLRGGLEQTHDRFDRLVVDLASRPPGPLSILSAALPHEGREIATPGDAATLARVLGETVGDMRELTSQIDRQLGSFSAEAYQFTTLTHQLQSEITRARLVPLAQLFPRLERAVHDAAAAEGKPVSLVTAGGDTPVDKFVLDRLFNPLLHVLRNAVVHGIESSDTRAAAGKPAVGTITVRGRGEAGRIELEITDDGAGLDRDAIMRAARERGWVNPEVELRPEEVVELIFHPGLSTVETTTPRAGRGVGLDAVREEITRLGGAIVVRSAPGAGTTFGLTLPLTLTVTRAMFVRCGDHLFAVPLSGVERVINVEPTALQPDPAGDGEVLALSGGGAAAVIRLGDRLALDAGAVRQAIVLRGGSLPTVLLVDRVEQKLDIVVKPLGAFLTRHPFFAGATLTGEGRVVFILDLLRLSGAGPTARRRTGGRAEGDSSPGGRAGSKRVLVVDDSLSLRLLMNRHLQSLGCEVTMAADGSEALETLRAADFDLVISDLEMPHTNGFELLNEIRAHPVWSGRPAVIVTTRDTPAYRARAAAMGAADYLIKPITRDQLAGLVQRLLVPAMGTGPGSVPVGKPENTL